MPYELHHFEPARAKNKKYSAILINPKTKKTKRINFGDKRYQQYTDSTGLGLYSHLDHNDPDRRRRYRARHAKTARGEFPPCWFSWHFLW